MKNKISRDFLANQGIDSRDVLSALRGMEAARSARHTAIGTAFEEHAMLATAAADNAASSQLISQTTTSLKK